MKKTNNSGFSTHSGFEWGFDALARAMRQAVTRTVRVATYEGKPLMKKTLRSRIAAVAVAALGVGLLQATPALAAAATSNTYTSTNYVNATVGKMSTVSVKVSWTAATSGGAAIETDDNVVLSLGVTAVPNASTVTAGAGAGSGTSVNNALAANAQAVPTIGKAFLKANYSAAYDADGGYSVSTSSKTVVVNADAATPAALAASTAATINFTPDVPGNYTIKLSYDYTGLGSDGSIDITFVAGANASASSVLYGSVARQDSNAAAAADTVVLGVVGSSTRTLQFVNGPKTQTEFAPGQRFTTADAGAVTVDSVTGVTNFKIATGGLAVGTYTFRSFSDVDGIVGLSGAETATTLTFTVANGAAGTFGLALATSSVVLGGGGAVLNYEYTITDADGVPSYIRVGEDATVKVTKLGVATDLAGGANVTVADAGDGTGALELADGLDAGTYEVSIKGPSGDFALTGSKARFTALKATATAVAFNAVPGAGVKFDSDTNGIALAVADTNTAPTSTVSVSTANKTVAFKFTGATYLAGGGLVVPVTVKYAAGTPITSGTAPLVVSVAPDGSGTVTLSVATPKAGYTYHVYVPQTDGDYYGFKVTYADPAKPSFNVDSIAPDTEFTAKTGSTNVLSAVLDNGFGVPFAGKLVTVTVAGRNPSTTQVTSGADGKVSFTLKDAGAVADAESDTVSFSHAYINALGSAASADTTFTINYNATGIVVGSVKVTNDGNAVVDTVQQYGVPNDSVVYSAVVADAAGLPIPNVVVTWSADANTRLLKLTSKTDGTGTATITAYRNKIGYAAVTATIGGLSDTDKTAKWTTSDYAAMGTNVHRYIAVAADPAGATAGGIVRVTATVTDRWGNPVVGVPLQLRLTGAGRLVTGEKLVDATVITDVNGTFQWNVSTLNTETGTTTATVTLATGANAGQTGDLAGKVGDYFIAGATAGVDTATVKFDFKAASAVADPSILALTNAIQTMMISLTNAIAKLLKALTPTKKKK